MSWCTASFEGLVLKKLFASIDQRPTSWWGNWTEVSCIKRTKVKLVTARILIWCWILRKDFRHQIWVKFLGWPAFIGRKIVENVLKKTRSTKFPCRCWFCLFFNNGVFLVKLNQTSEAFKVVPVVYALWYFRRWLHL